MLAPSPTRLFAWSAGFAAFLLALAMQATHAARSLARFACLTTRNGALVIAHERHFALVFAALVYTRLHAFATRTGTLVLAFQFFSAGLGAVLQKCPWIRWK